MKTLKLNLFCRILSVNLFYINKRTTHLKKILTMKYVFNFFFVNLNKNIHQCFNILYTYISILNIHVKRSDVISNNIHVSFFIDFIKSHYPITLNLYKYLDIFY